MREDRVFRDNRLALEGSPFLFMSGEDPSWTSEHDHSLFISMFDWLAFQLVAYVISMIYGW